MAGRVAEWLGWFLRHLIIGAAKTTRALPGLLGPAAVIYGATLVYEPAGWVVCGLFLLWLDRRIK